MAYHLKSGFSLTLIALMTSGVCLAKPAVSVNPSAIASGKPLWVASETDKSVITALVDIGTLRQIGSELQVTMSWPYMPKAEGPDNAEQDRIICSKDNAVLYMITDGYIGSDGDYHIVHTYDPEKQRKIAEHENEQMEKLGGIPMSYGSDPRSLACWTAARKCAGQKFTWPPPPNNTPLVNSKQAIEMNQAYNNTFRPTCTLK